jgi:cyclic pyranopterin phosphate synthase
MKSQKALIDQFNRHIHYVRLSVTDRCDLRCFYCMPDGFDDYEEPEDWLTFDEITRVIRAFTEMGVSRVRLTGGEPLIRHNVDTLIQQLAELPGLEDLSLSTNATRLGKHAQTLKQAGVKRINVSLDTLQADKFKEITKGKLDKVISGLMTAKATGLNPIKINMVVMKGVNDDEIHDMVDFCIEHGFTLRFIETMPMGDTGRTASDNFLSLQDVEKQLAKAYNFVPSVMSGGGPARYQKIQGTNIDIGFITPMSQHFCESCNRVRLSVDGTLYMCLGQEHKYELRPLLRNNISDAELQEAIIEAINLKPERHEFKEKPDQVVRFMSMTGG